MHLVLKSPLTPKSFMSTEIHQFLKQLPVRDRMIYLLMRGYELHVQSSNATVDTLSELFQSEIRRLMSESKDLDPIRADDIVLPQIELSEQTEHRSRDRMNLDFSEPLKNLDTSEMPTQKNVNSVDPFQTKFGQWDPSSSEEDLSD